MVAGRVAAGVAVRVEGNDGSRQSQKVLESLCMTAGDDRAHGLGWAALILCIAIGCMVLGE